MNSPNNEEDRVLTNHLFLPNEASSTRIGLPSIELLGKEVSWKSLNNSGFCQVNSLASTNLKFFRFQKTTSPQHINLEGVGLGQT